jgi:hypothetical protein
LTPLQGCHKSYKYAFYTLSHTLLWGFFHSLVAIMIGSQKFGWSNQPRKKDS